MKVCRSVAYGVVDTVKTEYPEDELPLDSDFAMQLLNWKFRCALLPSAENWMFPRASLRAIEQNYIRPAGRKLGLNVGWQTFQHASGSRLGRGGRACWRATKTDATCPEVYPIIGTVGLPGSQA
jgi:hypothetical protein